MVRRLLLALALALSPFAGGVAAAEPWQIANSDVLSVAAPDGHAYRVLVSWPDGPPPPQGWPVLYVLDGEDNFAIATTTARRLARARGRSGVEPGVIVAIDSGSIERRTRDYTPAVPGYTIPQGVPAAGLPIGGADAFLDVLNRQVKPLVEQRWRIDPARQTLLGHSFGGLFAIHALLTGGWQGNVAAVSPSLWYGNGIIDREERAYAPGAARPIVMIAYGDERLANARTNPAPDELVARLGRRGLDARFRPLPGFGHGVTMLASISDAMVIAFGGGRAGRELTGAPPAEGPR